MEKIKIGKIVNVVGLKGEVKVYNYSDSVDIYETTGTMYIEDVSSDIESVRFQKNMVIIKFSGVSGRDEAEALRGKELYITEADLPKLSEGQHYVRDLMGMTVIEDGNEIGKVTDVIQNTAQDIFEIERQDGKKVLIPCVDEFVLKIDDKSRTIEVKLIDGLLEL